MSTRSSISVRIGNKIKSIYCHFDGYPSYNGKLLYDHYNSQDRAEYVVTLGDLSLLGKSMECPEGHSYNNKIKGYSVAYGRDRGEDGAEAQEFGTYEEVMNKNKQEYNYFWDGSAWFVNGELLTQHIIDND